MVGITLNVFLTLENKLVDVENIQVFTLIKKTRQANLN